MGLKLIDLAPPAEIIHDPENSYRPKYEKLLSGLDREKIIEKIKTLTGGAIRKFMDIVEIHKDELNGA